jgi:hypothetical protein
LVENDISVGPIGGHLSVLRDRCVVVWGGSTKRESETRTRRKTELFHPF